MQERDPALDCSLRLLVPNPDTVRFSYVMDRILCTEGHSLCFRFQANHHQDRMMTTQNSVFLTGNSGVGKAGQLENFRPTVLPVC